MPDEFVEAYICHCSNCRAMTGSAFLPWGGMEAEKLTVTKGMTVDRAGCRLGWPFGGGGYSAAVPNGGTK